MEIFLKKRKMKKGMFLIVFICIIIIPFLFYPKKSPLFLQILPTKIHPLTNKIPNTQNAQDSDILSLETQISPQNTNADLKEKLDRIRKKLELKGFIIKGDLHIENKEYINALLEYLKIYKLSPKDPSIIEKIGDIYGELKKFDLAYTYYKKILPLSGNEKNSQNYRNKAIKNLIFTKNDTLTPINMNIILAELKKFPFSSEEIFYYQTTLLCLTDFSLCKKNFSAYFETHTQDITFRELQNIKTALENYNNFKIDDLSYKNALIVGALFSNNLYPIAIELGKKMLVEQPNYKPIIKIVAKSYFELGNYEQAKILLSQYNKILTQELGSKPDAEIDYFSGIVYEKLHDYVLSSIYLKNSINEGYDNSIDARRRIIYNYYQVGETDKMLTSFVEMIHSEGDKVSLEDFSLAIYYHIVENQIHTAKTLTQEGIQKYKESDALYGYLGWIQLEEKDVAGHLGVAEENLTKGLSLNDKNPMINFVMGKLYLEKKAPVKALEYFKKTITIGNSPEFSKLAQIEIDVLTPPAPTNTQSGTKVSIK